MRGLDLKRKDQEEEEVAGWMNDGRSGGGTGGGKFWGGEFGRVGESREGGGTVEGMGRTV